MILGISGTFASGQDTVGQLISKKFNLFFVSTSDIVREVAMKERGSIERPILKEVAMELRLQYGGSILVDRALDNYKLSDNKNGVVITGLRSLGEAKAIKAAGGKIIFTDAPIELRYERMVDRSRDKEAELSIEDFMKREAEELSSGITEADFNRKTISEMADTKIINDKTFQELESKIGELFF